MAMPSVSRSISTIEALLALPEEEYGRRHELLGGEHVVTPSPTYGHQDVVANLFLLLAEAMRHRSDLKVLMGPADIRLSPTTLVQPDLFVLRVDPARPPTDWSTVGIPVLSVEVLSRGTASRDRGSKRRLYQQAGVGEYWIVDRHARLLERWTPTDARPEILDQRVTWSIDGVCLLDVPIATVFGEHTAP